jgi:selenocysteine lyase/cysteine desulfurase
VALARRLQEGLVGQGYRLLTPPGTKTSIVSFRVAKGPRDLEAAFAAERIDVTGRELEVRVSPALFNTEEDIDRFLGATRGRS